MLYIVIDSRMGTPRFVIVLSKKIRASTSKCSVSIKKTLLNIKVHWNGHKKTFKFKKMFNWKRFKHRYLVPKGCFMEPFLKDGIWRANLWELLNFLQGQGLVPLFESKTFCSLFTWKETRNCNLSVIILGSRFIL